MKKKFNVWRLLKTLSFSTLITSFLCIYTFGVFARYGTSGWGADGARVAKFNVSVSVPEGQESISLSTGTPSATYSFTVKSGSEVAVEYDVVLKFPQILPDGIKLTLDGKTPSVQDTIYTFENVGTFSANGGEKVHTLTITSDLIYRVSQSGITVQVVARQID